MYIPHYNRNEDRIELLAFMRAHSFATVVTALTVEMTERVGAVSTPFPLITHLPLVIAQDGEKLRVSGHVARGNSHWQAFGTGATVAVFHGPHAYVSPAVYDSPQSVPTWNYAVVHASGPVTVVDDPVIRLARVEELIAMTDATYQSQWTALSAKYRNAMLNGIVAFDITVESLEGKYKLSQNKTPAEQERIADMLLNQVNPDARATGQLMRQAGAQRTPAAIP